MANWRTKTIPEIIQDIKNRRIVLPVIQRRLVWDEDKMTALFESLMKKNSFGGIICINQPKDSSPLFAFREFSNDGSPRQSIENTVTNTDMLFVLDGQQRLQSFYIGFDGAYNQKSLYFNLFSNIENDEFDFKFAANSQQLIGNNTLINLFERQEWYSAKALFDELCSVNDVRKVTRNIAEELRISDRGDYYLIEDNVTRFYDVAVREQTIGLSVVDFDRTNVTRSRQKIVEMFRVLNNGGTVLTSYDLMASTLKGFDARMERLLDELSASPIGINQDAVIKLLIILFGDPLKQKEVTDLREENSKAALNNEARLKLTLKLLEKFLEATGHADWFQSPRKKSYIPIYFMAYYIFYRYSDRAAEEIEALEAEIDARQFSADFAAMRQWLYYSLLNGTFSSGSGWRPSTTGLNEIYKVMRDHQSADFPLASLQTLYTTRLHSFITTVDPITLDAFDRDYLFYLIYDCQTKYLGVNFERDHIHPRVLVDSPRVNSIGNFEILTRADNRLKSDIEFEEWINAKCSSPAEVDKYCKEHLIPADRALWRHDRFDDFLDARLNLIVAKVAL